MKYLLLITGLLLSVNTHLYAQYESDVQSIESIVTALYESISGDAGVERDWDRFKALLAEDALLIPTYKNPNTGEIGYVSWDTETYINRVNDSFLQNGFHESELKNEIQRYGYVAHVFSSYESRRTEDGEVIARGINSIQLFYDGSRWFIKHIYWMSETDEFPLPVAFEG